MCSKSLFMKKNIDKYLAFRMTAIVGIAILSLFFNLATFKQVSALTEISTESILFEHNKIRTQQNLPPLEPNKLLNISAQLKANEMINLNCWSHYCPPNKAPWDYMTAAGYKFIIAGENLAEGFTNVESLMQAWLNSPTHRDNILRSEYTEIGIAVVYGNFKGKPNNPVIVVHFGKPNPNAAFASSQKSIKIIVPEQNQEVGPNLTVQGSTQNVSSVELLLNSVFIDSTSILDGMFFFNLNGLETGNTDILVRDAQNPNLFDNVQVKVVNDQEQENFNVVENLPPQNDNLNNIKNSVNIGLVLVLLSIFLVDFLVLKFTNIERENYHSKIKHSSFHFGVLLILLLVLLTGGVTGHITYESFSI